MEIGTSYSASDIFSLEETRKVNSRRNYSRVQEETTPSGDTVSISDEAKELFSKMIHKYDKPSANAESTDGGDSAEEARENGEESQGIGGSGGSGGGNSIEELKQKIQALKSQLSALASQMGNGADEAAMSKMNALEAQISALEAQLNAAA